MTSIEFAFHLTLFNDEARLFIDPSAEHVMLTRSAAVLSLLPSQFTSLLAGVIGI